VHEGSFSIPHSAPDDIAPARKGGDGHEIFGHTGCQCLAVAAARTKKQPVRELGFPATLQVMLVEEGEVGGRVDAPVGFMG
jgi:hypothetical protein